MKKKEHELLTELNSQKKKILTEHNVEIDRMLRMTTLSLAFIHKLKHINESDKIHLLQPKRGKRSTYIASEVH